MNRLIITTAVLTLILMSCQVKTGSPKKTVSENTPYTLLCIGDSYTIGESIPEEENFPHQLFRLLKNKGSKPFEVPVTVAKTGWTTDEMLHGLKKANLDTTFDFVTLCIGVNDQYRGRPPSSFVNKFEYCLNTAIGYARGKNERVIVLSIPDWGVTEYAKKNAFNAQKVAQEIDEYNRIKDSICRAKSVSYIDITEHYRKKGATLEGAAPDGLHPSAFIYSYWAKKVSQLIIKEI